MDFNQRGALGNSSGFMKIHGVYRARMIRRSTGFIDSPMIDLAELKRAETR